MNPIVFASLSVLVIFGQTVVAVGYTRKCKSNTEPCLNLKCEATQDPISVPFHLHYSCCKGHLFDQQKFACVRLRYFSYITTLLVKCDNCTQFTCGDGQCTMKQWKCDNFKNCIDGTDEVGCGPCGKDEFYCRNADQCISAARVCDKSIDCKDGSDELNCPNKDGSLCAGVNTFRCWNNNECIHWNNVCNGVNDCDDNSDEGGNCDRDTGKRDEISTFSEDGGVGGNGVDASTGTVVS